MDRHDAVNRRDLLLAGAAALALPGCATTGPAVRPPATLCLPRVNVAANRVIRQLVGLRPFRRSGFVVRAEGFADKRLVHNYGHGGAGITLCWGTSRLAVDLGLPGHQGPVAVIGAGVVGLTTARLVQEAGFPVTIYAKALPPETTSNIAGGQWYPSFLFDGDALTPAFEAQLVAAADYAYRRFQILIGDEYGVRWMRNYELSNSPPGDGRTDRLIASMLPELRTLEPNEHPFPTTYARQYDGMIVEPPRFLRAMLRDIQIAGGRIVVRSLAGPADIAALPEKLVFNCTGLGARELVGDTELIAARGQLAVLLPQPEIDYALNAPGLLYMFSRSDGIILGGSADMDDERLAPDPEITARIIDGHRKLFSGFRCG